MVDGPGFELQFLGGGRMAEALLGGMLAAGRPAAGLAVVEISSERREQLVASFPGVAILSEPAPTASVVVATKPGDATSALATAASAAPGLRRVLSIAAGVDTAALGSALPAGVAVVRAMPNTPALVGDGASAICAGPSADESDLDWAEALLGSVGTVVRVPESSMDAVTGLSGSGPAYVFLLAEALTDAGVAAGLPADVSNRLTRQTLLGAARLLAGSDDGPEALRAAVTSPNGTTAAGISVLEDRGFPEAVVAAVAAAAARSAELG